MAIVRPTRANLTSRRLLLAAPSLGEGSAELARRLRTHALQVTKAGDARAALRQVEERTFDLVICDVALPGGSGLAVLRKLRTHDARVPVVLLCGAERPLEEAAELGAFCLEKAVGLESLLHTALKRIRSHAPRGRSPRAAARTERTRAVAATVAKNQFGRLLGTAVRGGRVVITKHDAPTAVLMSFDEYQELTGADAPDLDALSHEFDELMDRMQTLAARRATEALFRAETAELAEAALAEARRDARSPERG